MLSNDRPSLVSNFHSNTEDAASPCCVNSHSAWRPKTQIVSDDDSSSDDGSVDAAASGGMVGNAIAVGATAATGRTGVPVAASKTASPDTAALEEEKGGGWSPVVQVRQQYHHAGKFC